MRVAFPKPHSENDEGSECPSGDKSRLPNFYCILLAFDDVEGC